MTGKLIKFEIKPSFNNPRTIRINPAIKARAIAASMYWAEPVTAIGARTAAVIRLVVAMGPTERERDVPKMAYRSKGAIEAYKPIPGGKPASWA
jgi:hypothetical protein